MAEIKEVKKSGTQNDEQRGRSQTGYPYFDLEQSIKVAEVIHSKGGGTCSPSQLAAWLDYASTRSGTYLTRVSAASKHFGLIESSSDSGFAITERAKAIIAPVMPEDAINAKVEAFLNVPLFSKVFEKFDGSQLPPEVGLKNLFEGTYKIIPDRSKQAVRVFLNSAEQAGFFTTTGDRSRLVKPSKAVSKPAPPRGEDQKDDKPPPEKPRSGGEGPPGGIHTAIVGVLRELPPPGTAFPAAKKQRFLDALKAVLDWVYPEPEDSQ